MLILYILIYFTTFAINFYHHNMNSILDNIRKNNPVVFSILQEQNRQPWELFKSTSGKTVEHTANMGVCNEVNKEKLCQLGVKY